MLTNEQKVKKFDKMMDDRKKYHLRRDVWRSLIIQKAVSQGLVVTEHEVDVEVKSRKETK